MATLAQVLQHRYPGTQWVITGDDYDTLRWDDSTPKPTFDDLDALRTQVDVDIANAEQAAIQAQNDQIAARASARTKLKALGLTDDEIAALIP